MAWHNDQVTDAETAKIQEIARQSLALDGDYVEMGCYKGDTSILLAEILQNSAKKLWIYDSFEGLPEKNDKDDSATGQNFQKGTLLATKREVKERFLRAGVKLPEIKKAWFHELGSSDLPEKIAFAFLDGDFYESIRESLRLVEGKMTSGGVILVHDYRNEALPGVERAVEEWLATGGKKLVKQMTIFGSLLIIMIK